jgi:hypothetical protein
MERLIFVLIIFPPICAGLVLVGNENANFALFLLFQLMTSFCNVDCQAYALRLRAHIFIVSKYFE